MYDARNLFPELLESEKPSFGLGLFAKDILMESGPSPKLGIRRELQSIKGHRLAC